MRISEAFGKDIRNSQLNKQASCVVVASSDSLHGSVALKSTICDLIGTSLGDIRPEALGIRRHNPFVAGLNSAGSESPSKRQSALQPIISPLPQP